MDETTERDDAHERIDIEQLEQANATQVAAAADAVRAVLEPFEHLIGVLYDRAHAYTNAIILAGYAAFFAIWSFTRDMVPDRPELLAALLMTISCAVFVGWELLQMISRTWTLLKVTAAFGRSSRDAEALQRLAAYGDNGGGTGNMRTTMFAWSVVLVVTVGTGVSAAGILVWAFIVELWQGLATPVAG